MYTAQLPKTQSTHKRAVVRPQQNNAAQGSHGKGGGGNGINSGAQLAHIGRSSARLDTGCRSHFLHYRAPQTRSAAPVTGERLQLRVFAPEFQNTRVGVRSEGSGRHQGHVKDTRSLSHTHTRRWIRSARRRKPCRPAAPLLTFTHAPALQYIPGN